ncbi:MAG: DegT/DnrJ/EryC1/StrS family aminotransferase [Nitrospirae bacterium]|nr:DegT/DnrJ/EryC1/StrS family aminotransferase [Nitrospirota bacterium]
MSNGKIPFLDLITPHREMEEELVAIVRKSFQTAGFIGGPMVENFEREFAAYCDIPYCVGLGSGTDALRFALMALGVGQGDMVITVPNTFIATTEAISQAGASIAFVDIDERTYNMDPGKLREFIETQCTRGPKGRPVHNKTGKTIAAIIPVHLYGQMADMDAIMETAREHSLKVVEDACQAHGAKYFSKKENRWRIAGSMGHAAAFSFYPGKNLGACGEAGAATTNDEAVAKTIKMIRDHGQARKYYHDIEGYNGRLDAIQAGILSAKLKRLPAWTEARQKAAAQYNDLLKGISGITPPYEGEWSKAVYHLYVIRTQRRDKLQAFLDAQNIATGLHYPVPLHQQKAYIGAQVTYGKLDVTEKAAREILSLPMFPGLTEEQQKLVARQIREYISSGAGVTTSGGDAG